MRRRFFSGGGEPEAVAVAVAEDEVPVAAATGRLVRLSRLSGVFGGGDDPRSLRSRLSRSSLADLRRRSLSEESRFELERSRERLGGGERERRWEE